MSDFKFTCPHCKQSLEAPQDMLGQAIQCPRCSGQIQLPAPKLAPASEQPAAPMHSANTSNASETKPLDLGMIVGVAAGAITLLKHLLTDKPLFLQVFGIGHGGFGGTLQETMLAAVVGVAVGMLIQWLFSRKTGKGGRT